MGCALGHQLHNMVSTKLVLLISFVQPNITKFMKKVFKLMSAALFALAMFVPAQAGTFTVCEGEETSSILPVYGFYYDQAFQNQMIYPRAELVNLVGKKITSVTFHPTSSNIEYQGGKLQLSFMEPDMDRFGSYELLTGFTYVATLVPNADDTELVFTLDQPYEYNGGDLAVECLLLEGGSNYPSVSYKGKRVNYACSLYHYGNYGNSDVDNFMPMITFGYEDDAAPITVYTVVGPDAIFGSNWDTTDTNNDMVLGDNGEYSWMREGVALYGNFDFKVVGNHSYDAYQWPMGPYNWTANVDEEGIYTILITFDPNASDDDRITCTLTKTGDIGHVDHTYTVAGSENLCGSFWDTNDTNNDMVQGEDGIYTWSKSGLEMGEGELVKFKVVQDHAWTYAWPSMDWEYTFQEAGTYNVVITFNADTKEITFDATKADAPAYDLGDVNMDGKVRIDDVTALIDYLLGGEGEINLDVADCNNDGYVRIEDVTALIDYLLNGSWSAK